MCLSFISIIKIHKSCGKRVLKYDENESNMQPSNKNKMHLKFQIITLVSGTGLQDLQRTV